MHDFDIIPYENILFSNLSNDGMHLKEGGVRKFAGNLIQFITHCQRCLCPSKRKNVNNVNYSRKRNGLKIASLNFK